MEYGQFIIDVIEAVDVHIRKEKKCSLVEHINMRTTAMTLIKKCLNASWNEFVIFSKQLDQSMFVLLETLRLPSTLKSTSFFGSSEDIVLLFYSNRKFIRLIVEMGMSYQHIVLMKGEIENIKPIRQQMVEDFLQKLEETIM